MNDQPTTGATQNIDKIIKRIEALLNTNGRNEEEARLYAAKAQELLEAYNLDMAVLGRSATGIQGAARKDTNKKGGLYSWQRRLWKAVAELNFCHYLSVKGLAKGSTYEHRLIGSHANVIGTQVMAEYLQATIEKLAQKWAKENYYKSVFVREAIAYREGMTNRISERLQERREEVISKARQDEQKRKQEQAARGEASTGSALTIVDIISSEADFNNDYLNGWELGTTARNKHNDEMHHQAWLAKQAEATRIHKEKMENDVAYRAAYEAKLAKDEEEFQAWIKKASRSSSRPRSTNVRMRTMTEEEKRAQMWSFREGVEAGDQVGIDTQIDEQQRKAVK